MLGANQPDSDGLNFLTVGGFLGLVIIGLSMIISVAVFFGASSSPSDSLASVGGLEGFLVGGFLNPLGNIARLMSI